jgi:predicted DsbA family dithiol-disulfide isomerase
MPKFPNLLLATLLLVFCIAASMPPKASNTAIKSMTIEIWSDVMCPFCYIGKRKFEAALSQFEGRDSVQVIWRSFQLDPSLTTDTTKSVPQSLSEKKGWSPKETAEMIAYVTEMAQKVGLEYHFDKAVVANSLDAHRFSHFALSKGKQIAAEERLFAAYFSEGKNTADHEVLADLGAEIGLNPAEIKQALSTDAYLADVKNDLEMARQFGINSVPFFVFNRKYAVSGAQDPQVFLETLQKVASE